MCSRLLVILLLPLFIAHCSFDTKDSENKKTLKVADSSSNLKCIDRDVVKFLDSGLEKTDESRVHKAFDCLVYAVDVIDSHINVKNQDDIKISSVKKLVKKKVKKYSEKTDKIIDIFFEAKVKALKGRPGKISHKELKKLKVLINDLRVLYINVFPTMQLMSEDKSFVAAPTRVSQAIYKLKKAEDIFHNLFTKYKISISRSEIESWLSVSDLLTVEERKDKWELYWSFHDMMWPKHKDITFKNVSYWLDGVLSVMSWAVKNRFSWTMQNYMMGETTQDVLSSTDDILLFIQRALNNKSSKTIYYTEINKVIDGFDSVFGLPRGLTAKTLKEIIPLIMEKLISVPDTLRAKPGYEETVYGEKFRPYYLGITMGHFNNFSKEFEAYKEVQLAIADDKIRAGAEANNKAMGSHVRHFSKIIKVIHPYFPEENMGLFIDKKNDSNRYNFRNLSMMNIFRSVARMVAMGYTSTSGRKDIYKGINVKELERFVSEFEVFFGEIYIMEKRNSAESVAGRMYTEAKLFVGSGDGYKSVVVNGVKQRSLVSFTQAVEVMANYTSGVFSIKNVYDELLEVCPEVRTYHKDSGEQVDLMSFGRPGLSKSCFKENYLNILVKHVDNLPHLQAYLTEYLINKSNLEKNDNKYTLEDNLIYSGQEDKNLKNGFISYTDISIIGTFLSFIESVFLKYDSDNNGLIDKDEVDNSFLYFKEVIEAKGYAQCSGVQFRHLLLYKSEGSGMQKIKTGTSCLGKYLDYGFSSSKNWLVDNFKKAKEAIKGLFPKEKVPLDENEQAQQALLLEAEREIIAAAKKNTGINKNNDLSVDRGDILEILTFMKKDSLKNKKK